MTIRCDAEGEAKYPVTAHWRTKVAFWLPLVAMVAAFVAWQWPALAKPYWEYDEGINVIKAQLVREGYRLYGQIWSDQPPLVTWLLTLAFGVGGYKVQVARGVALVCGALMIPAVALLARELEGQAAGLVAAVLLVLSPQFQELSRTILIGLPSVMLGSWACWAAVLCWKRGRWGYGMLAGLLFGLGMLAKPLIAPYYVALVLLMFWAARAAAVPLAKMLLGFHIPFVCLSVLLALSVDFPDMMRQVVGTFFEARGAYGFSLEANIQEIHASFGRGFYPALHGAALLSMTWLFLRSRRKGIFLAAWVLASYAAVLFHSPQRWHEHLLVVPPLTVTTALGVCSAIGSWRQREGTLTLWQRCLASAVLLVGGLILVELPSTIRWAVALYDAPLLEGREAQAADQALEFLRGSVLPGSVVITDDPMLAFQAACTVPPSLAVPSFRRIKTGNLSSESLIALTQELQPAAILFWQQRLYHLEGYFDWIKRHYGLYLQLPKRWIYVPCALEAPQLAFSPNGLTLLGSELRRFPVDPGETIDLKMCWVANQDLSGDYTLFVHLVDEEGRPWGQADLRPMNGAYPTYHWRPKEPVAIYVRIPVSTAAPAGEKMISVGWYDAEKRRLPLYDGQRRRLAGDVLILESRPVVRWPVAPEASASPAYEQQAILGDGVALLGYDLDVKGRALSLTLYWGCRREMRRSYTVFVHVVNAEEMLVAQRDQIPGQGAFPTTGWIPGEVIVDRYEITLPKELSAGEYGLRVGMYSWQNGERLPVMVGGQPVSDHVDLGIFRVP